MLILLILTTMRHVDLVDLNNHGDVLILLILTTIGDILILLNLTTMRHVDLVDLNNHGDMLILLILTAIILHDRKVSYVSTRCVCKTEPSLEGQCEERRISPA